MDGSVPPSGVDRHTGDFMRVDQSATAADISTAGRNRAEVTGRAVGLLVFAVADRPGRHGAPARSCRRLRRGLPWHWSCW
jgi:hypothetical protein